MNTFALGLRSPIWLVAVLAILAGGCAGPAQTPSQPGVPQAIPPAAATGATAQGDAIASRRHVRGELRIVIPRPKKHRGKRAPAFVSPSTQSLTVAINGAAPQTFDVAVPPCTTIAGGGRQCTFHIEAPLGHDTFAVSLYDGANANGTLLGSGSATQTVSSGGFGPTVTIVPVAGSIVLTLANSAVTPRVPSSTTLTVKELDPDGNPISGTYPNPIALTSTDATGAVAVNPPSVTQSGQSVTITYNGSTMMYGSPAIAASASGVASAQAAFTVATPCAPKYTPANLFATWDTTSAQNVLAFASPYTGAGGELGAVTYPVYMNIDPAGHIFIAQANTSGYPASTANIVYYTPPSTVQTSVTTSTLNIYGVAVDDKGNLFVSENGASPGVYESYGPLPTVGSNYATPVEIPNSPSSSYALLFDKYCNLFVDGATGGKAYVEVLGTTGQSGGGYGQLTPVVNTSSAFTIAGGMALDSKGNLFVAGQTSSGYGIEELAPPYTGTPTALPFTIPNGSLLSLATDPSDDLFFADYGNDTISISSPPYTSYAALGYHPLPLAVGVVYGPAGPTPVP